MEQSQYAGRSIGVLVGDLVLLVLFVVLGLLQHGQPVTGSDIIVTVAPFVIAWLVVGWLMGAFKLTAVRSVGAAFKTVVLSWIVAGLAGILLRHWVFQLGIALPFIIVALAFNLVTLSVWRVVCTLLFVRRRRIAKAEFVNE